MNIPPLYSQIYGLNQQQYDEYLKFKKEHEEQFTSEEEGKVKSKEILQLEAQIDELNMKMSILRDKLEDYMKLNFDLQLRLKLVSDKLEEYIKADEKARTFNTSKIIQN